MIARKEWFDRCPTAKGGFHLRAPDDLHGLIPRHMRSRIVIDFTNPGEIYYHVWEWENQKFSPILIGRSMVRDNFIK